jgi:hypothetical protein
LISTGISYDYIALKNKMLVAYPETVFDVQIVYKNDEFSFKKSNGKVSYTHKLANPFDTSEKNIIGGYCVIKNKRGHFFTHLSASDFIKHRAVAKTMSIWDAWYTEMCLKTLIKKAVRVFFDDVYSDIETVDNEQYDLEQLTGVSSETKAEVAKLKSVKQTREYYKEHIGKNAGYSKEFTKLLSDRSTELELSQKAS